MEKFCETLKGTPYEVFRHYETKILRKFSE